MHEKENARFSGYVKNSSRRKVWQKVVSVLACVVVFCTTYALILPAITRERDTFCGFEEHTHSSKCYLTAAEAATEVPKELICQLEEIASHTHGEDCWLPAHTHEESCYSEELVLGCGQEEMEAHTHEPLCYETVSTYACGLEEHEAHAHDAACYSEIVKTLTCTLAEVQAHSHSESCYAQPGGDLICSLAEVDESQAHSHTDSCYTTSGGAMICTVEESEGHTHSESCGLMDTDKLVCTLAETEGHTHIDGCYIPVTVVSCTIGERAEPKLICQQEETEGHSHADVCYAVSETAAPPAATDPTEEAAGELTCGLEEHTHILLCYSDVTADKETAADWEKTLPESLSGIWAEDVLAVAQSQMGYRESTANYEVMEDGETIKGYTRYGQWYGIPYGDWCAMFVSFCISYADVEGMPINSGCRTWIDVLSSEAYGLYAPAEAYIPNPGDLIFFDWDADKLSDHVGLVKEVKENTENTAAQIITIEGNSGNQVREKTYELTDETILGYGKLPANPAMITAVEVEAETVDESDVTSEQGAVSGTYYHMSSKPYYQVASHRIDNGVKKVVCLLYTLVSGEQAEGADDTAWVPSPTEWSAKAGANYLVAYCAEPYIDSASGGAEYDSFVIDGSRFTSEEQRRTMAGIIAHSYPYLTYGEMLAELADAYAAGELACDIANCTKCTKNELIVATQAAIWQLINPTVSFDSYDGELSGSAASTLYINPFADSYIGHGGSEAALDEHCNAIKDWLLKQRAPEELSVAAHEYEVTEGEHGTYNLTVSAQFNRAIISGETVSMQLIAGENALEKTVLNTGDTSFTVTLDQITEEELLNAVVSVKVSGKRMQAYFFDSELYQDFISGLWESYGNDISFRLTREKTEVSVTKLWTDGAPEGVESVTVQLYADGTATEEAAQLSDANNWHHVWTDLAKHDILGNEISYTIREEQVDGYYSSVEQTDGTGSTVTVNAWVAVDQFSEGGTYLIAGSSGALGVHSFNSSPALTWKNVDLNDADSTGSSLIWEASGKNDAGGVILTNQEYLDNPLGMDATSDCHVYLEGTGDAVRTEVYYEDGHLYMYSSDGTKRYFTSLYEDGQYTTADVSGSAANLTLYELQQVEISSAEINFILSNTKIQGETTSVTVTKQWAGREDGVYPAEAVVSLMQNGRAYGTEITLNEGNAWTYMWNNLPLTDNSGNAFVYSVVEVSPTEYTPTLDMSEGESSGYHIVMTNTWTPEMVLVTLRKVDLANGGLLRGAQFDLYLTTNQAGNPVLNAPDVYGQLLDSMTVGEDGQLAMELAVGETYYLVETRAPDGYSLLKEPIGFTVSRRGTQVILTLLSGEDYAEVSDGTAAVLTVKNKAGYVLPETGGAGIKAYTMAGLVLTIGSTGGLMYSKRKHRKEEESF